MGWTKLGTACAGTSSAGPQHQLHCHNIKHSCRALNLRITKQTPVICFTVDGDPHFIISVPQKEDAICFNINEKPGDVLSLINDPVTGEFIIFIQ